MNDPVRVAVVNDYEIVVVGLCEVLARYPDRVKVVEMDAGAHPTADVDVILYDSFGQEQGERMNVADLVAETDAKVVVFSWHGDQEVVEGAFAVGASGYVLKSSTGERLVEAIEAVAAGERVAPEPRRPPDGAPAAGDSDDSGDSADPGAEDPAFGAWPGQALGLSERESEVLALICQGLSNDDITKRAYLSINTVKTYIRTLYRKIGVTSRTQAVLWGLDHGFEPDRIARRVDC